MLVGAAVNLSAVAASLKDEPRIDILCAGTDGEVTGEDIMAAGALVGRLRDSAGGDFQLGGSAAEAGAQWGLVVSRSKHNQCPLSEELARQLRDTPGGRNLVGIGLESDLADCAQIDRLEVVPELDVDSWRIRPA